MSRRIVLQSIAASTLSFPGLVHAAGSSASAGPNQWWTRDFRIVQTNLREIDVLQEPREIARAVRQFGGNVIVSNIGGIVSFYPTEVEFHHRTPYMTSDFVGAMIKAAHAEGLAYVGRFDLSKAMRPAYDAHPDWFMRNRDGTPREFEGTYQACPNGGWAQSHSLRILDEALRRYKPDGVFFNLTGYPQTDYANVQLGICVCNNCRRGFRDMHGIDLPATEGFKDPAWTRYLDFQERTANALGNKINAFVAPLIPGVPILRYDRYKEVGRAETQRRVQRPAPEWPYQAGEVSRLFMARNPGLPFTATSTAHIDYPWRQVTETAAHHQLRFAQMLGVGGKLDLYLMGTLADQDDQSYLAPVSRLFHWAKANGSHYAGMVSDARVALYQSGRTDRFAGATAFARYQGAEFRGVYAALVNSRVPFRFISDDRVVDGTTPLTGNFDVIILPNTMVLGPEEARALDAFVAAGGLLIATGATASLDREGRPRTRVPLAAFPLERYDAPVESRGWSLDPSASTLAVSGRVPLDGPYLGGTARQGASNLLPFAPDQPFGPPELSYAPPKAPRRASSGLSLIGYGRGYAVHVPWLINWQYHRDGLPAHQQILAGLISAYAPPPRFVLEGAGPVELMQLGRRSDGARLLHVVNYAGQRGGRYDEPPAIHGLRLGVRGAAPVTATALIAGKTLVARKREQDGLTWFDLPPCGTFEAILLDG